MKRKCKNCFYYCFGYCFWNGDTGEVCDTDNNQHEGYCPREENDRELEEHANAIIEKVNREMEKEESIEEKVKKLYGLPPFDNCYNVCRGDGYYKQSIINKFGKELFEETCKKLRVQGK